MSPTTFPTVPPVASGPAAGAFSASPIPSPEPVASAVASAPHVTPQRTGSTNPFRRNTNPDASGTSPCLVRLPIHPVAAVDGKDDNGLDGSRPEPQSAHHHQPGLSQASVEAATPQVFGTTLSGSTDAFSSPSIFDKPQATNSSFRETSLKVDEPDRVPSASATTTLATELASVPPLPPRSMVSEAVGAPVSGQQPPSSQQTNPTDIRFPIKKTIIKDASGEPRTMPFLMQKKNGPCPLIGLVNTIVLSTPPGVVSDVVEALKNREEITLETLVHSILGELYAEHHATEAGAAQDLQMEDDTFQDPQKTLKLLKSLNEGLMADPSFIPDQATVESHKRKPLLHVEAAKRDGAIPGSFRPSKELSLCSRFGIPVLHGWLPPQNSEVCKALEKRAVSYDQSQEFLCREFELDQEFAESQNTGSDMGAENFDAYWDLKTIKKFLDESRTGLTDCGLDAVRTFMKPGSFAMLFRNEHFSTLYRHPENGMLFMLVTDVGMASHQEVVWESLVDTTGNNTEYFSGDFLPVGGPGSDQFREGLSGQHRASQPPQMSPSSYSGNIPARTSSRGHSRPALTLAEQEDRDLATAMALDEELNRDVRAAQSRRREEQQRRSTGMGRPASNPQMSTNLFSTPPASGMNSNADSDYNIQSASGRSMLDAPQCRAATSRGQMVHRPANEEEVDAPPSYEDAAFDARISPPQSHSAYSYSVPGHLGTGEWNSRPAAVPGQGNTAIRVNGSPGGRRQPGMVPPVVNGDSMHRQAFRRGQDRRDKDCLVM